MLHFADNPAGMLTILGPKPSKGGFCDGVSRRNFLKIGALGLGGLALPQLLRAEDASGIRSEGQHKAVIMICLGGGPSHLDTYDMRPQSPVEYRGEFRPIRTRVPGIDICELFPRQAAIMDRLSLVRGVRSVGSLNGRRIESSQKPLRSISYLLEPYQAMNSSIR